ncbi:MAG: hypothetical protein ACJZ46_05965 [Candidatus Thalassarchaeaceae archaeon]
MQRRRRPKVAPRNVFGSNIPPRPQKKPKESPVRKVGQKTTQKVSNTVPSTGLKKAKEIKKLSENEIIINKSKEKQSIQIEKEEDTIAEEVPKITEEVNTEETQILEDNILGRKTKKKSIGLQKKTEVIIEEDEQILPSSKAMELIEKSRIRATEKTLIKETDNKAKVVVEAPRKPKPRSRQKTYQPATRLKRLDRSKHMEYKYEMRSLLVEINVIEEYRSNMLASIWAKGERQSTKEAKEYIDEKMKEGVLNEDQHKSLTKVIENYTIRR